MIEYDECSGIVRFSGPIIQDVILLQLHHINVCNKCSHASCMLSSRFFFQNNII
jgi:hypothetical protein